MIQFLGPLDQLAPAQYDLLLLRMICAHCSAEMPEISAFCPACGRSVVADSEDEHSEIAARGVQERVLGALAYVAIIPAIVLLTVPALGSGRFVRFHAWQSIFLVCASGIAALTVWLLFLLLRIVPFVGFLLAWLLLGLAFMAVVVLWGVLVVKAAIGESYELPWIGPLAAQLASKGSLI